MKFRKQATLFFSFAMAAAMLTSCGGSEAAAPAAPESTDEAAATAAPAAPEAADEADQFTIGCCVKTVTNDDYLLKMVTAVEGYCDENGYGYMLGVGGSQGAVAEQVNAMEDLINQGVDCIVLAPNDANAFVPVMQQAADAGIPVVLADATIADGYDDLFVTFVGTANVNSAEISGKTLVDSFDGAAGEVLLVKGSAGASASEDRTAGYMKALEGSNLTLVAEEHGNWDSSVAMQAVENMVQAHPDAVAIVSCSDVMFPGILSALENAGKDGVIKVASHDGFKLAVDALNNGTMFCTVITQPGEIGKTAADIATQAAQGTLGEIEKFTEVAALPVTAENIAEYADYTY